VATAAEDRLNFSPFPPAFGERRHRGLARRLVAVRRRAILTCSKASVHIHGVPSGAAAARMMNHHDAVGDHVVIVVAPFAGWAAC
jgi:hypothetical protein